MHQAPEIGAVAYCFRDVPCRKMAVDTVGPLRNPPVDRWSTSHFYDLKGFFLQKP